MKHLRLGTRKSPLALWQAEHVQARLQSLHPGLTVELVRITTEGDRILDRSLARVGGKGLFIKELEQALGDGRIDLAVHSLKDMTVTLPPGMRLAAVLEREDPRDAFVSSRYASLAELPARARLGTASLRRQCQIRATYPLLKVEMLRGNVNTRLSKLDAGDFDAILLAGAGLKRLGFETRIRRLLDPAECLPAVGQGAISIESRDGDDEVNHLLSALNHAPTRTCVTAERAMNAALEGGCQVPIGGYAILEVGQLYLRGLVGEPDGSRIIRGEARGPAAHADDLGQQLARDLLARGARDILDKVYARG